MELLTCLDSEEMASRNHERLSLSHGHALRLGQEAVKASLQGYYVTEAGQWVDWKAAVEAARAGTRDFRPEQVLPPLPVGRLATKVQVMNETTMEAARLLIARGLRPCALNFASGTNPGGGFLNGALAQEETLCRSSALYVTLEGQPMYEHHRAGHASDATDWAILSPDVPFFRNDGGSMLEAPYLLSVLTCAAPKAYRVGQELSRSLLSRRIRRVLHLCASEGFTSLVLGAWGCGAFGNDPVTTAEDFRTALAGEFEGVFEWVLFAITDWSPERKFLGPFRDAFAARGDLGVK